MLVSVIVPAYNAATFIQESVRSALDQTHRELEVIVVDDGSTDDTAELASSIHDSRVRVLSAPHAGLSRTRNRGLQAARGEAIAYLDADDLWWPRKLEKQLAVLWEDGVVAVGCMVQNVSASGRVARRAWGQDPDGAEVQAAIRRAELLPFPISAWLFRTAVLRALRGFDETVGPVDDLDLMSRTAHCGRVAWVPEPLAGYRIHRGSILGRDDASLRLIGSYVRWRASARHQRPEMTLDEFRSRYPRTWGDRREDLGSIWLRRATADLLEHRYLTAAIYSLGVCAMLPGYAFRRAAALLRLKRHSSSGGAKIAAARRVSQPRRAD